jgi:hypothetical protein
MIQPIFPGNTLGSGDLHDVVHWFGQGHGSGRTNDMAKFDITPDGNLQSKQVT